MTTNDLLVSGIRMSTAMIQRMTADLTPEELLHQPAAGANCAAWIVGHLAMTLHRSLGRLGVTDLPTVPDEIAAKFQMTKQAAGKQEGLGDTQALLAMFNDRAERLQAALAKVTPEVLEGEPEFRPPGCANRGDMLLFLGLHNTMHAGQISTIRRSLGKPPLG